MNSINYSISLNDTNAVKGIAIIAMLLHHLFYSNPEYGVFVHEIGLVGKICVAMFLFLSGYGLTVQFSKVQITNKFNWGGDTLQFEYKRFVKFYLNYWVIFLIFVPLGIFVFERGLEIPYGDEVNIPLMLFKDFMGINSFKSYNITWWFNRLIISLYVLFPLLYLITRNKFMGILLLLVSYRYPNYFQFICGIMVATHINAINRSLSTINIYFVSTISIIGTIILCVMRQMSTIPYAKGLFLDGYIAIFVSLSLVSISRLTNYQYKVLPYLGKHSMNMYMVHTFIFEYFFKDFIYGFKYPIFIFLALLVTSLAVSIVVEFGKESVGFYKLQRYLANIFNKK